MIGAPAIDPLQWLADGVWKGALLLTAAWITAALLGRAGARPRQLLWGGALIGLLALTALSPWVSVWPVAGIDWRPASAADAARFARPATRGPQPPAPERTERATATAVLRVGSEPAQREIERRPIEAQGATSTDPARADRRRAAPPWPLLLWSAGAGLGLLWLACGLWRIGAVGRRARRLDAPRWRDDLEEATRRVGLARPVRLALSGEAGSPVTWGLFEPVILLPETALDWSAERRRIVLLHELVHVRRHDWLLLLVARATWALHWFNPLAWLAIRRLAVEQERACDEAVVSLGTRPSTYARHLLSIATTIGPPRTRLAPALEMARRSQMEGRLMSILEEPKRRTSRVLILTAALLMSGLVPTLATMRIWSAQETTAEPGGDAPAVERVEAALAELQRIESELEPLEEELDAAERRMQPLEREMEVIEREMEPVEAGLENFERELEPFEERMESFEATFEPHESELEEVERAMEPFEERLEALDDEMEPFERRMEELEATLEPLHDELERLHDGMEPIYERMAAAAERYDSAEDGPSEAEMAELDARLAALDAESARLEELMGPLHRQMEDLLSEMEPLHDQMARIHEEMQPFFERMAVAHEAMRPSYEEMARLHEEMAPVYERMSEVHEAMRPFHERMAEVHERMQPFHDEMHAIHERMEPIHERMVLKHEELELHLTTAIAEVLETELGPIGTTSTDFQSLAERVLDRSSVRIDDGRLRMQASTASVRELLIEELAVRGWDVDSPEVRSAIERAARAVDDFEVAAD